MDVVIIHYHLKPGGVTRVIENAIASLGAKANFLVISTSGEKANVPNFKTCNELGYCETAGILEPNDVLDKLIELSTEHFGKLPDIWHIHNHSLGKNIIFPEMIHLMAERSLPMLLQIHDFSEDGRSKNYQLINQSPKRESLYPKSDSIHYGVLNGRDFEILKDAGFGEDNLHLIPNAIHFSENKENRVDNKPNPLTQHLEGKKLYLYPTRSIRRKNIGEVLFLSLYLDNDAVIGLTLSPDNEKWLGIYNNWKTLSRELNLNLLFELGETKDYNFEDLLDYSEGFISTSIAEGFGLAFLEPWIIGKPLWGRNIKAITKDFTDAGISLDSLYTEIPIPISVFNMKSFLNRYNDHFSKSRISYGIKDNISFTQSEIAPDGFVDFGSLDEIAQEEVILHYKNHLSELPELKFIEVVEHDKIIQNKETISEKFDLESYGERLENIYREIIKSKKGDLSFYSREDILSRFSDRGSFHVLRL